MKRKSGQYPYNDYWIYVVYHSVGKRNYAQMIHKTTKKRHTISLARYKMSVKLNRVLDKNEHVDHIDNNKLNDKITNLQILTVAENNIKYAKTIAHKMVLLKCPSCKKIFSKGYRNTHLVRKKCKFTSCSRKCMGRLGKMIQMKQDVQVAYNENVIKIYYERD